VDYLVRRKTNYMWNDISSPSFKVNVGVGQGSALSPILSALYLSPFLYILEKRLKILIFLFLSFLLKMTDLLFLRINQLTFWTLIFSVAIMYWPNFLTSLVLSLNTRKLKHSTLTGCIEHSIHLHLISLPLEDLFFIPKTHGSIWDSFLTESLCSINTLTITQTKPSQWSDAWSFLGIQCKESTQFRNAYCIDAVYSPSLYTVLNYGFITKLSCHTIWKSWGKCREEPLFGFWEPLKHRLQKVSKIL